MEKERFGVAASGREVVRYTLDNGSMRVRLLDYGGVIQSLEVPDRAGKPVDVALGYEELRGYEEGSAFHGAIVGRYANRIEGSAFPLDGKIWRLPANEGKNHLHGTFPRRSFEARELPDGLGLSLVSPAGEDGFPGTVKLEVRYRLEGTTLHIEYEAVTDAPTVLALTNHCYFNLAGGGTVEDHVLTLRADRFCEVKPDLCPTGRLCGVEGTALDLRTGRQIGRGLEMGGAQLELAGGYDHCFALTPGEGPAATLTCPRSGISLALTTTEPGVQVYSGNYVQDDPFPGKSGKNYPRWGGVALEAGRFPSTPTHPEFPSAVLRPGETYFQRTSLTFGAN